MRVTGAERDRPVDAHERQAPDSSAAALTRALGRPLDGLETDCCPTADGELVLLHDPLFEVGTTVSGSAHERTAAQIRAGRLRHRNGTPSDERPLLLDELLGLAPPGATLQLEVKAHADPALARRTARALCERLRDHPTRERTEVISFWSGACELAAELGFRARLVVIADYRIHALAAWGATRRPPRPMRRALPPLARAGRNPPSGRTETGWCRPIRGGVDTGRRRRRPSERRRRRAGLLGVTTVTGRLNAARAGGGDGAAGGRRAREAWRW